MIYSENAFKDSRIKTVPAYSSVYNSSARWPEHNFTDVVNNALENPGRDNFDVLIMSAPTVDISTANLNPLDNTEAFQQQIIVSAQNMFSLAQSTLEKNKSLSKVILLEHPQRLDDQNVDPTSLKRNLTRLDNTTLFKLRQSSPFKDRIVIGHHNLSSPGQGPLHVPE